MPDAEGFSNIYRIFVIQAGIRSKRCLGAETKFYPEHDEKYEREKTVRSVGDAPGHNRFGRLR